MSLTPGQRELKRKDCHVLMIMQQCQGVTRTGNLPSASDLEKMSYTELVTLKLKHEPVFVELILRNVLSRDLFCKSMK